MTINKSRSFNLARNEKGALSGVPLVLLTLILIAAVLGLLAHWFLGGSNTSIPVAVQPTAVPTTVAPAPTATVVSVNETLASTAEAQLKSMDFFKFQVQPDSPKPVTIEGKTYASHWERYRLPELYTAEQLADLLGKALAPLGAKLVAPPQAVEEAEVGTVYSCLYTNSKNEALEIDWIVTSKPRICIIIDDAGYQKGAALEALYGFKLPVTCSIIPHTEYSNFLAQDFPLHGVEVMCHLPMEGHDHVARGAYKEYLKKGMNVEKATAELKAGLADLPNCKGLNNHMGSVATTDLRLMKAVCEELKAQNMFVIDSKTSPKAVVSIAAKAVGIPVAQREFFLDNQKTPGTVLHEMKLTAAYAKKHGLAVAIGHFNVITLKTLKVELQKLQSQGYEFVYASEVVKE